jgi:hypothetical protein
VQRTVYGFPVRGGADGKLRKKIRGELPFRFKRRERDEEAEK